MFWPRRRPGTHGTHFISMSGPTVHPYTVPVRNDFQSVYFFVERRGGTFYKLEPWNKRKYVWPSRLRGIDAFHSVLSANFVAILLSPNFARRRASNLCVLYNTVYTEWYSKGQTRWNGLKIGECVLNNVVNKFVHQYCDLICNYIGIILVSYWLYKIAVTANARNGITKTFLTLWYCSKIIQNV